MRIIYAGRVPLDTEKIFLVMLVETCWIAICVFLYHVSGTIILNFIRS